MTCKDCVHYCLCKDTLADENWGKDAPPKIKDMYSPKGCENFKNKADVVEVVRCRDCVYCNEHHNVCHYGVGKDVKPDHYCSYGERKEEK